MFKVGIDWDKAHKDTTEVLVEGGNLIEVSDNHWLRKHSLRGLMGGVSFKRKLEETVAVSAPSEQPPLPCPVAPGAPTKQFVKMDKYQFDQLLATIKEHATNQNVRENAKLTHMQIHEKLLGLLEHD